MLKEGYSGKDKYIRPLTEVLWSEYLANFMSSPTADENFISLTVGMFADAVERTKPLINNEIAAYRSHADLLQVLDILYRHGGFLIKSAAYCLGYVDGEATSQLSSRVAAIVSRSYFEKTFNAMSDALREMKNLYPKEWKGLNIYDRLAAVVEDFYKDLGFIFSNLDDGGVYVEIP